MRSNFYALGRLKIGEKNKTEARYGYHLELRRQLGEIVWYRFESIKLRLADNTFLTVDYAVMRADGVLEMHDCKGSSAIYLDDARVKMKVAAELFPFVFKLAYPIKKRANAWTVEEVGAAQTQQAVEYSELIKK